MSTKMLQDIFRPIEAELAMMEHELSKIVNSFGDDLINDEFRHPFYIKGKRLRPALMMLSARTVNAGLLDVTINSLISLAAALELIHNASLVHDDVIDEDVVRRGKPTINSLYGNKIAVLVGDALNARAFQMIARLGRLEFLHSALDLIEKMSIGEILQIENSIDPQENIYLKVIEAKTALFVELSCGFGAMMAGGTEEEIRRMKAFGLNLGMAYQIIDDLIDGDPQARRFVTFNDAVEFADISRKALAGSKDSLSKDSLLEFINLVLTYPDEHQTINRICSSVKSDGAD